jgi:hypothetical protein
MCLSRRFVLCIGHTQETFLYGFEVGDSFLSFLEMCAQLEHNLKNYFTSLCCLLKWNDFDNKNRRNYILGYITTKADLLEHNCYAFHTNLQRIWDAFSCSSVRDGWHTITNNILLVWIYSTVFTIYVILSTTVLCEILLERVEPRLPHSYKIKVQDELWSSRYGISVITRKRTWLTRDKTNCSKEINAFWAGCITVWLHYKIKQHWMVWQSWLSTPANNI